MTKRSIITSGEQSGIELTKASTKNVNRDNINISIGTRWECIDEDSEEYGLQCVITSANTDPVANGDGDLVLQYNNGLVYHGKLRRFIPGITHRYID